MAYNGSIDLISGIRPKNNGTFPLVDAKDVYVTDDKRLDAALNEKMPAADALPKPEAEGTEGQVLKNAADGATAWGDVTAEEVKVSDTQNLAEVLSEKADADDVIPKPAVAGTEGQHLEIDANGNPVWLNPGTPTDTQVGDAVDAWLTAHPEATTTVQDGSITRAKLDDDLKEKTDEVSELKSAINANEYAEYNGDCTKLLKRTQPVLLANYSVGDVVDTSPLEIADNTSVHFTALFDNVVDNDLFYLNITDGATARPWAFLDKDKKLLSMASDAYAKNIGVLAPEGAKYFIVQCGDIHISTAFISREVNFGNVNSGIKNVYNGEYNKNALEFCIGTLDVWGVFQTSHTNRIAMPFNSYAMTDITLRPAAGFRVYVFYYNSDGSAASNSGWQTVPYTISKGSSFRMIIARVSEITETADINTFLSSVIFSTPFNEGIHQGYDAKSIAQDNAKSIECLYDGDYVKRMASTGPVLLGSLSIGDVVDLSPLNTTGDHKSCLITNVAEGECFYLYIVDGATARPWAFLDKDNKLLAMADSAYAQNIDIVAPANTNKLIVQCGGVHYSSAKLIRYNSFNEYAKSHDIVMENNYTDTIEKLENICNSAKNDTSTTIKSRANLLCLIHFSDIHGSIKNIKRILRFKNEFSKYIFDILHTGDAPAQYYGDENPFSVVGGDEILEVVGNHECWIQGDTWPSPYNATAAQVYTKFFAPFISSWSVTSAGENLCYYYKDYTAAKTRLIVLDAIHYDATQEAWFETCLAGAKTNEYRVVAVTHYPPQTGLTGMDCTFNSLTSTIDPVSDPEEGAQFERMPESAYDAVDAFISDGGEFVCWLSGHTHDDYIGTVTSHTDQIQVIISCGMISNQFSDCARTQDTKTQDLFNIFAVDGNAKLIKIARIGSTMDKFLRKRESLCVNYDTKNIISN